MEDTILYSSCFDANTGLFETLLGPEDAIISDSLNHASIIEGIRLCTAKRLRYKNNDLEIIEAQLKNTENARFKMCNRWLFFYGWPIPFKASVTLLKSIKLSLWLMTHMLLAF